MKPESVKIGGIIRLRVEAVGMAKAELARRLHMSPANVHKIFKRNSVDARLLQELSNVLDYDFFQHFQPELTSPRKEPAPYDVSDTEVLFIRYVVDLQARVQILEQHSEMLRQTRKAAEEWISRS
jgi:transcriptional regulator with XRE-family HTH domain